MLKAKMNVETRKMGWMTPETVERAKIKQTRTKTKKVKGGSRVPHRRRTRGNAQSFVFLIAIRIRRLHRYYLPLLVRIWCCKIGNVLTFHDY